MACGAQLLFWVSYALCVFLPPGVPLGGVNSRVFMLGRTFYTNRRRWAGFSLLDKGLLEVAFVVFCAGPDAWAWRELGPLALGIAFATGTHGSRLLKTCRVDDRHVVLAFVLLDRSQCTTRHRSGTLLVATSALLGESLPHRRACSGIDALERPSFITSTIVVMSCLCRIVILEKNRRLSTRCRCLKPLGTAHLRPLARRMTPSGTTVRTFMAAYRQ